jgi:hypothetical protein
LVFEKVSAEEFTPLPRTEPTQRWPRGPPALVFEKVSAEELAPSPGLLASDELCEDREGAPATEAYTS